MHAASFFVLPVLLAMSGGALAQDAPSAASASAERPEAASAPQQAAQQAKPVKEKKVCRSERVTGSLTRVIRTCMTQREWDELAASTRRDIDQVVRDAGRSDVPASSGQPGIPGGT